MSNVTVTRQVPAYATTSMVLEVQFAQTVEPYASWTATLELRGTSVSGTTTATGSGTSGSVQFNIPDVLGGYVPTVGESFDAWLTVATGWPIWSSEPVYAGTVTVAELPVVAVTSPAASSTVTDLPLRVEWSVADQTGVAAQRITVESATGTGFDPWVEVYSADLSPYATAVDLSGSDLPWADGTGYRVTIDVTGGSGLSGSGSSEFATSWTQLPAPTVTVSQDLGGIDLGPASAYAVAVSGAYSAGDSMVVERVHPDGTRTAVASGLAVPGTALDLLPPLGVPFSYAVRVVDGQTGVPGVEALAPAGPLGGCSWVLTLGTDPEACAVPLGRSPSWEWGAQLDGELYHLADGGGLPTLYPTTDLDEEGTLSATLTDRDLVGRLMALSREHPAGWLRDPYGNRWRARVAVSVGHERHERWAVSVRWTAIRWEEA